MSFPKFAAPPTFSKGEKIYDFIRKRYVRATNEEWVRQQLLYHLVKLLGYPKTLIGVERQIHYLKQPKRVDILVYTSQLIPLLLFECKAPHIPFQSAITEQVGSYNYISQPVFLGMTNGSWWSLFKREKSTKGWIAIDKIPTFSEALSHLQVLWKK